MTRVNKPTIHAAIFDMDGLLLDTESLAMTSCLETGTELGFDITGQLFLSIVGRDWKATRGIFAHSLGADFPFDTFQTHWRKNFEALVGEIGIPKKTGTEELLQIFRRRSLPMAVATSTGRDKAVEYLLATGILDHFHAVIAGDEIERGKPAPDIFLTAAQRLGVAPANCMVFEDSEPGVEAAHAAGMLTILVPDLKQPSAAVRDLANGVFSSLLEARSFVETFLD